MYITIDELKTALYQYQSEQIAEGDSDSLLMNIAAAQAEVRSYLASRYNVDAIFAAEGAARDPLLLELTKNIAVWYIVRLSNVDIVYQPVKERYDAAIDWLNRVADGKVSPDLPPPANEDGSASDGAGISWGSSEPRNNNFY
jgi:phage gp36-like protein